MRRWQTGSAALCAILLIAIVPSAADAGPNLLTISPRDGILRTVDGATGQTLDASVTVQLAGESLVQGGTGLARHPGSGDLYALIRVPSTPNRLLVTVNETTGVATRVGPTGNTGDRFAAITFAGDGTLYAVTGDGAGTFTPETLCTLSTLDASASCFQVLGNGSDGEALGYRPADGLLYHASGIGVPNDPAGEILETVHPGTGVVTPVTLSGHDYEALSVLSAADGAFWAADIGDPVDDDPDLLRISATGAVFRIGPLDHVAKGIVASGGTPAVPVAGAVPLAGLIGAAGAWMLRGLGLRPRESRR